MPASPLADRVAVLRIWATARIEKCLREETKPASLATIEFVTERRTLQAVLALLADDVQASIVEGDR